MKRICSLILSLCMLLSGLPVWAAEGETGDVTVAYGDLPPAHRTRFEAEMASALANARARAPGQSQLQLESRGEFNGYSGSASDGSLQLTYTVSDSMVQVGERVSFDVYLSCNYPQMTFTIGGLVMDESFSKTGDLVKNGSQSTTLGPTVMSRHLPIGYTPTTPGYFNFVIVVTDGLGNQVAVTTNTIQVYEGELPNFDNIGSDKDYQLAVDNNLAMRMSVDKMEVAIGETITATATFTTMSDPVRYNAKWTLTDPEGNELDSFVTTGETNAQEQNAVVTFPYIPYETGELQFVITATDGDGNEVKINTPYLPVPDGFYFEAELNRTVLNVGGSATGTYRIYGHECEQMSLFVGWESYNAEGKRVHSRSSVVKERSGFDTYAPRLGEEILFYVGASCPHHSSVPAVARLVLVGGLVVDMTLTADSVQARGSIGLEYYVEAGVDPYQSLVITGYSYDASKDKTYDFYRQTVTQTEGTVYATPYLGDEVYFTLEVTEADGLVSTWRSDTIPLTGAPEVTDPQVTASLSAASVEPGETVTLTYRMSGGSGTLNSSYPDSSYICWKNDSGAVIKKERVTAITGEATFAPETAGSYTCELVITDAYHQHVSWTGSIEVVQQLPGDANADGAVDFYDALTIMQLAAGWSVSVNRDNADVNGSGGVDLYDALEIIRRVQSGS